MFVVRYLIAAIVTIVLALIGGIAMDYSVWTSIGIAFIAVVFLQILILGYVVFAMIKKTRASKDAVVPKDALETRPQLFILPK
ncbi:hypothetical protein [Paracoccus sp. JM45]|uniref:hypothetical protein n=1 Tax=Paracoccus sp. JM45 TaxID=2283626 RepID=UPI000E6BDB2E|nr:hypothetical protein [Paracoccus sp. JM45]RJE78710.1 hypothetical protein DWB67_16180 [Paracoccus sp. JM45]